MKDFSNARHSIVEVGVLSQLLGQAIRSFAPLADMTDRETREIEGLDRRVGHIATRYEALTRKALGRKKAEVAKIRSARKRRKASRSARRRVSARV